MAVQLPRNLNALVESAVRHFWNTRSTQARRQKQGGSADQGARSAVTGGAQMDGFIDLFARLALRSGARPHDVLQGKNAELPGCLALRRRWDLLVMHDSQILCAFKFACTTLPASNDAVASLADNAVGSAFDFWRAYGRGALNHDIKPWLGYLLLVVGLSDASNRAPRRSRQPSTKLDAAEYGALCRNLVRNRFYDGAALLLVGPGGNYSQPAQDLGLECLCRFLVCYTAVCAAEPTSAETGQSRRQTVP